MVKQFTKGENTLGGEVDTLNVPYRGNVFIVKRYVGGDFFVKIA